MIPRVFFSFAGGGGGFPAGEDVPNLDILCKRNAHCYGKPGGPST